MKKCFLILVSAILFTTCNGYRKLPDPSQTETTWRFEILPHNPQPVSGDPEAGLFYLANGNYIGSGVPFDFLQKRFQRDVADTVFNRQGVNRYIHYTDVVFEAANGVRVMSGNCFTCHAGKLNGEVIPGLGNSFSDFQNSLVMNSVLLNTMVKTKFGKNRPERKAFANFGNYYKAVSHVIKTPNPGVNPAFRIEEACANHRSPEDLQYRKKENLDLIKYTLASDVPPLWHVSKKNALYYNGMGRGAFSKLFMQASVLGASDSTFARQVWRQFDDALAWVQQIKPPAYPYHINSRAAQEGSRVFEEHCSTCHGSYLTSESYPNKLVSLQEVGTDPYYALYFTQLSGLANWYNESWFATSEPRSGLDPSPAYVAPPLDGIWATAPYLHNGSVPTLLDLMNSAQRPKIWQRSGDSHDYDYNKVGWQYQVKNNAKGKWTYDTRLPGYGNQGHTYADKLSDKDKTALLEFLKGI